MSDLDAKIEAHLKTAPLANSLTPLFCKTLCWGASQGMRPQLLPGAAPGDRPLTAVRVAQLSGVHVFRVDWPEERPPTIERLGELAFRLDELGPSGQPPVAAVIDRLNAAFSVEKVTKEFYQEIANWYFWARDCEEIVLPKDVETAEDRALFLIRLLTRLIFCWFLRKKRNPQTGGGLLPDALFEE